MYSNECIDLVRLLIPVSFLVGINYIMFSVKRVTKDIPGLLLSSGLLFVLLIGTTYVFVQSVGLLGVAYAWLVSYLVNAFVVSAITVRGL